MEAPGMDTASPDGCAVRAVIAVSMLFRPSSLGVCADRESLGTLGPMGKVHESIDGRLANFLLAQPVFFVGTAPSGDEGHVNVSPKGLSGSFAVLGPREVAYLDLTGSGAETIAHLRDNGRVCLMFCAFSGPPKIVRLHGRGEVVLPGTPGFEELAARFPGRPGTRSVIRVAVDRVSDSCGYAVPLMQLVGDRAQLVKWAAKKGPEGLDDYRRTRNDRSIDGLPALDGS